MKSVLLVSACGLAVLGFTFLREAPAEPSSQSVAPAGGAVVHQPAPGLRPTLPDRTRGVRVAGVMVQRPLVGESEYGEALPFMGTFAHTRLALEIVRKEGGIVSLRREDCTLASFVDDRGTSLLPEESHDNGFEMLPSVAADGTSVAVVVASKKHPAPGATRVGATGEIALLVATEKKVETSAVVAFEEGAQLEVGPFSFELEEVGTSEWSGNWALTLQTKTDIAAVLRWVLVDEEGNETELNRSSSWSGMGQFSQTVESETAFERGALRLEFWADAHVEKVPFEATAGIGL